MINNYTPLVQAHDLGWQKAPSCHTPKGDLSARTSCFKECSPSLCRDTWGCYTRRPLISKMEIGCFPWAEEMRELAHKESWTPKYWCFWTVIWRRLLRVPWTARRSNQSILKEINPEYLILKLKLQYFGHLIQIANLLEKTLMLGKTEGRRKRGW